MVFLHEHYTEKHGIFLNVFPCFPERSNIVFSKCFLVWENVVKTRCSASLFLSGAFHRQTRCFPECFPFFSDERKAARKRKS